VREKECTGGGVIELTTIVALDGLDGEAELGGHPCEEVENGGKSFRLCTKRKSPGVMREIIKQHKIELVAGNADDRRSPEVAMYKIKDVSRLGRRTMKRKTDMTAQLTRMTQMLTGSPRTPNVGTATELHQGITTRMAEAPVPSGGGRRGGESS
jgi:hypothetical protein